MRPEEQRSLVETPPEISPVPQQANSPLERAQALVTKWENTLMTYTPQVSDPLGLLAHLTLTQDVRDLMRDDIAALLNQTISFEHVAPTTAEKSSVPPPYDSLEASSRRLVEWLGDDPVFEKLGPLTFSAWQAVQEALGMRPPFVEFVSDGPPQLPSAP